MIRQTHIKNAFSRKHKILYIAFEIEAVDSTLSFSFLQDETLTRGVTTEKNNR